MNMNENWQPDFHFSLGLGPFVLAFLKNNIFYGVQ
jgi:hypothetical protein